MFLSNYIGLLLGIALTIVNAKVTFKVIAIDGTPSVVINNKKYEMKLLDYPIYQAVVDVNAPVKYHYSLKTDSKTEEESFTRQVTESTTLNEFFNRAYTVKKHPLLPKAYETPSTIKQSKLYDDTHISTFVITGSDSDFKKLHNDPENGSIKIKVNVIFVNPYTIKKYENAKIAISGQSTTHAKKLSYKISNLKYSDPNDALYGRSAIRLRGEHMDPTFLREKLYTDILNSLGVPSVQNTLARVFINKKPIGLFDLTDDLNSSHFIRSTFNGGKTYNVENAIFKVDYYPEGGAWGDLGYYGSSSKMYDIYYYKGEKENYSSSKDMVKSILVPFLSDGDKYPSTQKLNFDIKNFLKQMAVEYAAAAMDNYWIRPGNFYIFKDMTRDQWSFIDCDLHLAFGISGNEDANKLLPLTVKDYVKYNDEISTARPLLDNIRKVSSNESYFKEVFNNLVKYAFNIHALGPRIDSLADLIREDVYWDLKLSRVSGYSKAKDFGYSSSDFEAHVKNTSASSSAHAFPLKYWIKKRSELIASQFGFSVPSSLVKSSYGNYSNVSDYKYDSYTTDKSTNTPTSTTGTTSTSIPTSKDGRCGSDYGTKCPNSQCCSKYGHCGTSKDHCETGCQAKYGICTTSNNGDSSDNSINVSTVKGRCGPSYGKCGGSSQCCSKYNYCGTTKDHCEAGCQAKYGICTTSNNGGSSDNNTDIPTSKDGRCGTGYGTKCPNSQCCSKYGHCGTSKDHCETGCQSKYGICTTSNNGGSSDNNTDIPTSKDGRCGTGYGTKCPNSQCCSKYGHCGTSKDHCETGCQSKYGICTNGGSSDNSISVSTVKDRCGPSYGKCSGSGQCCSKYNYCGTTSGYCGTGCQSKYGICN